MARIEGEIVIARPVEAVFDFVADERKEPGFQPAHGPRRADLARPHRGRHRAAPSFTVTLASASMSCATTLALAAPNLPRR